MFGPVDMSLSTRVYGRCGVAYLLLHFVELIDETYALVCEDESSSF